MLTIEDLKDPKKYVPVENVPLLDEHVLRDADGSIEVRVNRDLLEEVAENNNRKFATTGDPAVLIVGHTKDGDGEPEKPAVGYAINFRVEPYTNTEGKKVSAIYADLYYRVDRAECINDYPRRSIELWLRKREIDPIALLGGTTPERDLGVVRLSRVPQDVCYRYAVETMSEMKSETKPDDEKMKCAAEEKTKSDAEKANDTVFEDKRLQELMGVAEQLKPLIEMVPKLTQIIEAFDHMDADGDGDHDLDDHASEMQGDESGDEDDLLADHGEVPDEDSAHEAREDHEGEPVKFDYSAGSVASATNSMVPETPKKMSRSEQELAKRIDELEMALAKAEAEKTVAALEAENIVIKKKADLVERLAYARKDFPQYFETMVAEVREQWIRKTPEPDKTQRGPAGVDGEVLRFQRDPETGAAPPQPVDPNTHAKIIYEASNLRHTQGLPTHEALEKARAKFLSR